MKLSEKGYILLKHYEGIRLEAYQDSVGVWTIGAGNTFYENGSAVKKGDTITYEEAIALLYIIAPKFERYVESLISAPLTQSKFDALVVFTYNLGKGALQGSTLRRKLNEGKPDSEIALEFHKWNKAGGRVLGGLTKRRAAEAWLFEHGDVKIF